MQRQLPVVTRLGNGGVFKQRAQLGRERSGERVPGFGAHADAEVGLLFGGFGYVEQRDCLRASSSPSSSRRRLGGIERKGEAMLARSA
jgi:hypothetical protein